MIIVGLVLASVLAIFFWLLLILGLYIKKQHPTERLGTVIPFVAFPICLVLTIVVIVLSLLLAHR